MNSSLDIVGIRLVKEKELVSDKAINSPLEAINVIANELKWLDREMVMCLNLNNANQVLNAHVIAVGGLDQAFIDFKNIAKSALLSNAAQIMLIHNHPSGNCMPSHADNFTTEKIKEICKLIGIKFLDHIIIGRKEFYSYKMEDTAKYSTSLKYMEEQMLSGSRMFFDMDGVLAHFNNQIESEEVLYQQGYFKNLLPQTSVLEAVNMMINCYPEQCYILTAAVESPYAIPEKKEWLSTYVTSNLKKDHILFAKCGEPKSLYIEKGIRSFDILVDDYTKNLDSFVNDGGRGIKVVNAINDTNKSWKGKRVFYNDEPVKIFEELERSLLESNKKMLEGYLNYTIDLKVSTLADNTDYDTELISSIYQDCKDEIISAIAEKHCDMNAFNDFQNEFMSHDDILLEAIDEIVEAHGLHQRMSR